MKYLSTLSFRLFCVLWLSLSALAFAESSSLAFGEVHDELVIMVNINKDDSEKMATVLAGIGPARADAIVAYRIEHGPFTSVDELLNIRGIGERTLAAIRHQLHLGEESL